jgi:hypothetical protein
MAGCVCARSDVSGAHRVINKTLADGIVLNPYARAIRMYTRTLSCSEHAFPRLKNTVPSDC